MINLFNKDISKQQAGSAFVYILIAIALLAALTASFMRPSSQQTTSQSSFQTISKLDAQVDFIQAAIQECILTYAAGDDSDIPNIPPEVNQPYPFTPTDDYFELASGSGAATDINPNDNMQHIGCPGNPGTDKDHAKIFGGRSGKFLPPPPDLFNPWQYYNGTDGIFMFISTDKTDAFLQTALEKLDDDYSECQADVIDASAGDVELTSTERPDDPKCFSGETCFRVWIISKDTATFNGDTDDEELDADCP